MPRMVNDAGYELIQSFESCSLTPYLDGGGVPTIGWGHTKHVTMDMGPITQEEADDFLDDDLDVSEDVVNNAIKVPLTDNQFSALVSLVFNCGPAPLSGTLGHKLNAGDYSGAAQEFPKWDHVNKVVSIGLLRRRNAEMALFLKPC